ncbi:MAG: TonB-dependent receptor [Bacteroidota bacterium]
MNKLLLSFCALYFSLTALAQPGNPRTVQPIPAPGVVLATFTDGKTNKPIEYVTVSIQRMPDSATINGTTTTKKGEIKLENIPYGIYRLKASFIGYKSTLSPIFKVTPQETLLDIGVIQLEATSKTLKQVEINSERTDFSNQLDKKTYNVGKNITNIGGSATDVLQNIPSVNVDMDGKISLRGSENVTILIDGKPSTLTGANRQAILQQLPANAISEVEVITNPSAKYDADGMAGIINIKTKKDKLKGFNANTQATVGTRDKYSFNLGLNNRTAKYNLYGNYSYRHERREFYGRGEQQNFFDTVNNSFTSKSDGHNVNDFHTGRVGVDLFLNNYNTLSVSGGISSNISNKPEYIQFDYFDNEKQPSANFKRNNYSTEDNLTLDATVDYKKTGKKNKSDLTASATISNNNRSAIDDYNNPAPIPMQRNQNTNNFTTFIAQVDYQLPLTFGKWENGLKTTNRLIDNDQVGKRLNAGSNEFDYDAKISNHFLYKEQVNAAYTMFSTKKGRFDFQAGLRAEFALTEGNSKTTDSSFSRDYFNLFPSGYVKYALTKTQDIQFGYSRRVNRPNMEALNPFVDYSDSINLRKGNPEIRPEYIHSVELNYLTQLKKFSFSTTVYYRYTENMISRLRTVNELTGQSMMTFYNFSSSENTGVEVIVRYSFDKLGSIMLSGNWFRNVINGSNVLSDLQSEITTWNARFTYSLPLPKGFFFQANGMYMAPMRNGQNTISGMNGVDAGLRKDFMKGKLQLGLNVTDIFDIRQFNVRQDGTNFVYDGMRKRESRIGTFSLSYRFGSNENPFTKKKTTQVGQPTENMDVGF